MKTRRELIAEVEELGRDLGREISTGGLSNAALGELVDTLRAELEEQTSPAAAPATPVTGAQRAQPTPATARRDSGERKEHAPPAPPFAGHNNPARELKADEVRPPPPIVHDVVKQPTAVDGAAQALGGPPTPKAEQPKAPSGAPYYVAPGRSIVAGGRVLGPMKPVKATDFPGGQKDLDYFVLKGAVVRA